MEQLVPSIEKTLPNLEGWSREQQPSLSFPCLTQLTIKDCPKLTTMPLCPSIEELKLNGCTSDILQIVMTMKPAISQPHNSLLFSPSHYSEILERYKIQGLRVSSGRRDWMLNLSSVSSH
uniref:Uncharacterized protein n=1 Tax=Nelumbo nucifera TaxID=4432 RepID=A0A822Z4A2_NELNU|nr:TPA_asm: hypothetical protein HUJ06_013970 [Nelumbo nucifera]